MNYVLERAVVCSNLSFQFTSNYTYSYTLRSAFPTRKITSLVCDAYIAMTIVEQRINKNVCTQASRRVETNSVGSVFLRKNSHRQDISGSISAESSDFEAYWKDINNVLKAANSQRVHSRDILSLYTITHLFSYILVRSPALYRERWHMIPDSVSSNETCHTAGKKIHDCSVRGIIKHHRRSITIREWYPIGGYNPFTLLLSSHVSPHGILVNSLNR